MTETKPKLKLTIKPKLLNLNIASKPKEKVLELGEKKLDTPKVSKVQGSQKLKEHKLIEPEIYRKILGHFRTKYPNCFSRPRRLIAIGIFNEVVGECEEIGVSKTQLKSFFKAYCSTKHYKQLMIVGAERFGLLGNTTSLVAEQELRKSK